MPRLFLLFVAASTLALAAWFGSIGYDALLLSPSSDAKAVSFRVEPGWSVKQISSALEKEHLIKNRLPFQLFVKFTDTAGAFKAGAFELKPGMSYAAIVATLTVSTKGEEVEITIPEGYTAAQIGDTVRAALPEITNEQWSEASKGLEGYLFPDTYRFGTDATAADVVAKMRATFDRRMAENGVVQDDAFRGKLILASIVEREVRSPEEMAKVADIFLKRLDAGIALQADSTVNYAIGGTSPSVSYKDLQVDSPYNTYKYPGLPPGPISNPGMNAILAVIHPEPNPYYYFLTTPDGEVKYARTFEEHLQNRARFLR